jgi:glycosyltransferase involved in cell wall biosynthesis
VQKPFFSIVIPTRNRPALFIQAVLSALRQDFEDFEVVVSDNSSDEKTQRIVEDMADPRLRIFKPDTNLSMHEHWEFATQKANGQYVMMVTDRSVLKRHALRTIHAAILSSKSTASVCYWRWTLFDEKCNLEFADYPIIQSGKTFEWESSTVAKNFANGEKGFSYNLPRTLNSCYSADLAKKIRDEHGTLFTPISPDFTSAFYFLAYSPHVLFLDIPLFISQGLDVSNGGGTYSSVSSALDYLNSLGNFEYFKYVPLKIPLVENMIFEDFLSIQAQAGGNLAGIELSWPHYFITCYRELIQKKAIGPRALPENMALFIEWTRVLATFDHHTQTVVKTSLSDLRGARVRTFIKNTRLGPFILRLKRRYECRGHSPKTILEHAGFN